MNGEGEYVTETLKGNSIPLGAELKLRLENPEEKWCVWYVNSEEQPDMANELEMTIAGDTEIGIKKHFKVIINGAVNYPRGVEQFIVYDNPEITLEAYHYDKDDNYFSYWTRNGEFLSNDSTFTATVTGDDEFAAVYGVKIKVFFDDSVEVRLRPFIEPLKSGDEISYNSSVYLCIPDHNDGDNIWASANWYINGVCVGKAEDNASEN